MENLGTEPQQTAVTIYHALSLAPPLARGSRLDDLYIKDGKVVVLGVDKEGNASEGAEETGAEFAFASTIPSETPPSALTHAGREGKGRRRRASHRPSTGRLWMN